MAEFKQLHGVIPVSATPYNVDGRVDYGSIRAFVDYIVARGIHGLATTGGSGKFWQLTDDERKHITRVTVDQVSDRVPVVCGVAGTSIQNAILYTQSAQDEGADAVFAMPPYVHGLAPEEMYEYYKAIAEVAVVPLIVQDVVLPGGRPIPTSIIDRLARDFEIIKYVKEETPRGNLKASEIIDACGEHVQVLVGAGGFGFLDALNRGCVGCMPGPVNVGGLVRCYNAYRAGDLTAAREWYEQVLPLITLRMQFGNVTKEILRRNGAFKTAHNRPPRGEEMDEFIAKELDAQFEIRRDLF
jgi:dihydrodipicolinate synthase/N-acetylneuraminate lyase